jgi:hypothetical protein
MITRIGVIAEDRSDIDVFCEITRKIAKRDFVIKPFLGKGCGKLRRECSGWAVNLREQNCTLLVLIHDLDNNEISDLQNQLREALGLSPIRNSLIVIPVKEIEAWLLSDEDAIRQAMNLRTRVSRIPNPETIDNPKEHIERLVEQKSQGRKHYLNTVHNKKIASMINIEKLKRCKSFLPLEQFLRQYV